ncbi:MAG: single-stranded-DNA-specific exonuclease RecJ [Dehalococcoidia bacterium]
MKWKVLPPASKEHLSKYPDDVPPLLAQLLYNRGVTNPAEADKFLAADERLRHDPDLLPDIDKAVARIMRAVRNGETIAVFGDFDADGVTAAAVLVKGLEQIGGKVIPYIPHRVEEGHGLNIPAVDKLHAQGISLLITVDCGVTSYPEAEHARQLGIDLIITDHHEAVGPIPTVLAVIDPKLPEANYPFRELAGVGVAYKLVEALFKETGRGGQADEFLDLVALGTVADLVPLKNENRYLVNRGLEVLNSTDRIGIKAMISQAGLEMGGLDSRDISYALAPRLNAAGRLDHASVSYDILITESPEEARRLADLLDMRNVERQNLTREYTSLAEKKLGPIDSSVPILIVADEAFHAGVNGVVAGKLTDKYYRPAIIIEIGEEESNGSARSIPEFNMISALQECSDLFPRYGGHEQAAGFGIPNHNLGDLKKKMLKIAADRLDGIDLQPTVNIDTEIQLTSMRQGALNLVKRLEPCGKNNDAPVFLSRGVRVMESRPVGSDGDHIKLKLGERGMVWDAIGFGLNHLNADNPPLIDIVYNLKLNRWRGKESLQLEIIDFAPSM